MPHGFSGRNSKSARKKEGSKGATRKKHQKNNGGTFSEDCRRRVLDKELFQKERSEGGTSGKKTGGRTNGVENNLTSAEGVGGTPSLSVINEEGECRKSREKYV